MWKTIYDQFLQFLSSSWALYIQQNASSGRAVRDKFYSSIYMDAGLLLMFTTFLGCILYYYYFNLRFGKYYTFGSWIKYALLICFVLAMLTYLTAYYRLNDLNSPTGYHTLFISLINFLYGLILFFVFSCLMKWGSPMGKRTPF